MPLVTPGKNPSKELAVQIKLLLDKQSAEDSARKLKDFKKQTELQADINKKILAEKSAIEESRRAQERYNQALKEANALRRKGQELQQIGGAVAGVGALGLGTALVLANNYVKAAGMTEDASSRWSAAMYRFETAGIRAGRVVAQEAVPYLEQAVGLAEKLADFAEKHPEIIDAALKLSAGAVAVGGTIAGAGAAAKLGGTLGQLFPGVLGAGGAAAGAGGAASTGTIAAAIAPIVVSVLALVGGGLIGQGAGELINKQLYGPDYKPNDLGTNAKLVGAAAVGGLGNLLGQGDDWTIAAGKFFGILQDGTPKVQAITDAFGKMNSTLENSPAKGQAVQEFQNYQEGLVKAEEDRQKQETAIIDNYNKQKLALTTQYEKYVLDFLKQQAKEEQSFYHSRQQIVAQGSKEIRRIEEDSQKRLAKLKQEHDAKIYDLTLARDALGVVQENRAYDQQRKEEIDNTNEEIRRRRQDLGERLKELSYEFQVEQQQRAAEFAAKQAEYQQGLAALAKNKQDEMTLLATAYKNQLDALQKAFIDRINALDINILSNTATFQAKMAQLTAQFQDWINNYRTGAANTVNSTGGGISSTSGGTTSYPGRGGAVPRGSGGYMPMGLYKVEGNQNEFMMNSQSTRAAEQLIGSQLTQANLLQALAGGSRTVNMSVQGDGLTVRQTTRMIDAKAERLVNQLAKGLAG